MSDLATILSFLEHPTNVYQKNHLFKSYFFEHQYTVFQRRTNISHVSRKKNLGIVYVASGDQAQSSPHGNNLNGQLEPSTYIICNVQKIVMELHQLFFRNYEYIQTYENIVYTPCGTYFTMGSCLRDFLSKDVLLYKIQCFPKSSFYIKRELR